MSHPVIIINAGSQVQCPQCKTWYKYGENINSTIYFKCLHCGHMIRSPEKR